MPTCAGTVCPFAVVAVALVAVVPVVAFIFSTQSSIEVIEQTTFYTRTALAHAALTPGPDSWASDPKVRHWLCPYLYGFSRCGTHVRFSFQSHQSFFLCAFSLP